MLIGIRGDLICRENGLENLNLTEKIDFLRRNELYVPRYAIRSKIGFNEYLAILEQAIIRGYIEPKSFIKWPKDPPFIPNIKSEIDRIIDPVKNYKKKEIESLINLEKFEIESFRNWEKFASECYDEENTNLVLSY